MIEGESFVDIRLIVDHHCFNLLFIRSEANESDTFSFIAESFKTTPRNGKKYGNGIIEL
jgi:hypothetical protein